MTIVFAVVGVAVAAISVWLMVRIINRRERWVKWTAVALVVVLVGYPLSWGPAIVFFDIAKPSPAIQHSVRQFFRPCVDFCWAGPEPMRGWYQSYVHWWERIGNYLNHLLLRRHIALTSPSRTFRRVRESQAATVSG